MLEALIGVIVGFFLNEIHRIFIEKRESEKILKIIEEELRVNSENIKEQHSTLSMQGEGLLNKKSASLSIDPCKLKKLIKIYQKCQMINKGLERYVILDARGMPSKDDLKNKISKWRDECSKDIEEYLNTVDEKGKKNKKSNLYISSCGYFSVIFYSIFLLCGF